MASAMNLLRFFSRRSMSLTSSLGKVTVTRSTPAISHSEYDHTPSPAISNESRPHNISVTREDLSLGQRLWRMWGCGLAILVLRPGVRGGTCIVAILLYPHRVGLRVLRLYIQMRYEWDEKKNRLNQKKHGVSFQ